MELKSNWRCYVIIIVFATVTATSSSPSAHLDKVVGKNKIGNDLGQRGYRPVSFSNQLVILWFQLRENLEMMPHR